VADRSVRAESSATATVLSHVRPVRAGGRLGAPSQGARSSAGWLKVNGAVGKVSLTPGKVESLRVVSTWPTRSRGSAARQMKARSERVTLAQRNDKMGLESSGSGNIIGQRNPYN
jgi:hypothetical protein